MTTTVQQAKNHTRRLRNAGRPTSDQIRYQAWLDSNTGRAIYEDLCARLSLIRPDADEVIARRQRAAKA